MDIKTDTIYRRANGIAFVALLPDVIQGRSCGSRPHSDADLPLPQEFLSPEKNWDAVLMCNQPLKQVSYTLSCTGNEYRPMRRGSTVWLGR